MHIVADLHTHTMVSQHAYSTVTENLQAAKARGFCALGMTDHGPGMPDGAIPLHFLCTNGLPDQVDGVRLLRGIETNIMDFSGRLDLEKSLLARLDIVIAAYHVECITPGARKENTAGMIAAIRNPLVDCIAHCGNPAFPIDIPAVVRTCREEGKLLEINSNSFSVRPGSETTCRQAALECMAQGVRVIVSSDAHFHGRVGDHAAALELLESVSFPEELVVNSSRERLWDYFSHRTRNPIHE